MKAYVDKTLDTNNDIENIVVVETNGAVMVEKFKKFLILMLKDLKIIFRTFFDKKRIEKHFV